MESQGWNLGLHKQCKCPTLLHYLSSEPNPIFVRCLEFSPVQQVSRKGLSEVNGSEVVFRPGSPHSG